jgi:hypothetical protein
VVRLARKCGANGRVSEKLPEFLIGEFKARSPGLERRLPALR